MHKIMRTLDDLGDVKGKIIFVRVDFNVPIVNGAVGDDFRIQKSFETIDKLQNLGAHIILASHIEGGTGTLEPVFEYLKNKYKIVFVKDYFSGTPPELKEALDQGNIVLLENLRKYGGEKENDEEFGKHLASFANYYVNEAFSSSHRSHASIVSVPKYIPGYAGIVFESEINGLSKALHPEHPFFFILGGAKFETKFPLAEKFFKLADTVFIGGALANDFLKAKGLATGKSLLSTGKFDLKPFLTEKLILPIDVVVSTKEGKETKMAEDVLPEDTIVDVGIETLALVVAKMRGAKLILWNGPLGNYENGFKEGTEDLARAIASSETESVVGGGDTVASIASLGLNDKFSFISTAGGAMLDFLANETLPGITALEQSGNV
jgi:phosphoglycerate kinase